jgi:hypothetical protein
MEISKMNPIKNKRNFWKNVNIHEYQVKQFILL